MNKIQSLSSTGPQSSKKNRRTWQNAQITFQATVERGTVTTKYSGCSELCTGVAGDRKGKDLSGAGQKE